MSETIATIQNTAQEKFGKALIKYTKLEFMIDDDGKTWFNAINEKNQTKPLTEQYVLRANFGRRLSEKQKPVKAIWHAGEHDLPVTIIGAHDHKANGVEYMIAEGTESGIPKSELEWLEGSKAASASAAVSSSQERQSVLVEDDPTFKAMQRDLELVRGENETLKAENKKITQANKELKDVLREIRGRLANIENFLIDQGYDLEKVEKEIRVGAEEVVEEPEVEPEPQPETPAVVEETVEETPGEARIITEEERPLTWRERLQNRFAWGPRRLSAYYASRETYDGPGAVLFGAIGATAILGMIYLGTKGFHFGHDHSDVTKEYVNNQINAATGKGSHLSNQLDTINGHILERTGGGSHLSNQNDYLNHKLDVNRHILNDVEKAVVPGKANWPGYLKSGSNK